MATQPTQLPVPSEKPQDLKFNAGKIDEFVTSMGWTYTDRFGNKHYTIEGMRWLAQQAIAQYGYITIDSFQAGATVSLPNQALRDTSTGEYYRWDGALPKVVPANSTPASTGGVGVGAWLSVGDATLRPRVKALEDEVGILSFRESSVIWADDYPTLQAAYNATPAGGILRLGNKTYEPISPITKAITIVGAGMPSWNSGFTGLTGGSIIKGPLAHKADNVRLFNFGVDSGSAVCSSLYAGVAQEGICCLGYDAKVSTRGIFSGFVGQNLISIAKDSPSAVHAFALEGHINAITDNIQTCYGVHGQAYKVIDSNINNLYAVSAGSNGVVIKRDENAECNNSNFSNIAVNCYGSGGGGSRTTENGIQVNSSRGDQGVTPGNLSKLNISNVSVRGAFHYGMYFSGAGVSTDVVADINVTNAQIFSAQLAGYFLAGNTERILLSSCSASASGQFGFADGLRSKYTRMVNCFAGNNENGFVGAGANFIVEGCSTKGNTGTGYYSKVNASCYRSNSRGEETTLWSGDAGNYWFELGSPSTGIVQPITLLNSWVNFGGAYGSAQYFIASDGLVRLQGAISSGAIGSVAFTLPVGFRPQFTRRFVVAATTSSADVAGHVIISTNGNVLINSGGTAFMSLDDISFLPAR